MTYAGCLFLDAVSVLICGVTLIRYGKLSHSHPAAVYILFHLYTFTWRLISLTNGAPTLFTDLGPGFLPITEEEIARAAVLADVALLAITVGCVLAMRSVGDAGERDLDLSAVPTLNYKIIWGVVAVAMPLGIYGLLTYAVVPSSVITPGLEGTGPSDGWSGSSYVQILPSWPGLLLLILIYYHGFRRWLTVPMVIYLLIMAVQGYHRFRVVLPVVLLLQIYLDRQNRRWPGAGGFAILFLLALAFFPMKVAGRMVQQGAPISEIAQVSSDLISEAGQGQAGDQQFLDQYACTLALVDGAGDYYYGKPFLAMLTLPIPRIWWPDKPGLADHIIDFSRPWRPMGETGMILTYIGDGYANFGYAGVLLFPLLIGFGLTRAFRAAYRRPYSSLFRFTYLMLACNLIQVFRDGILSLVMFALVHMMPLTIIVILHKWFGEFRAAEEDITGVVEERAARRALRG